MARIDLVVPFGEDEEARRTGAQWDSNRKRWFVPEGADPAPFRRWRPSSVNVRSTSYWIAQLPEFCWKCRENIQVFGLILPRGYEVLLDDDREPDEDEEDFWEEMEDTAILTYIEYLSPMAESRIVALAPHYRRATGERDPHWYWTNHCSVCGIKQGDHWLFREPSGGFLPTEFRQARDIRLHRINSSLEASAAYTEAEAFAYLWRT